MFILSDDYSDKNMKFKPN